MTRIDEIGWEDLIILSNTRAWSILKLLYYYELNFYSPITFEDLYLEFYEMPNFKEELETLIESNFVSSILGLDKRLDFFVDDH